MKNKAADHDFIPPTYLHNLKYQLTKKGRANINERDKRLLQYIRTIQESRCKTGIFRLP